ncbi:hypothetical protein [Roseiterribacter gracilis]
MPWFVLALAVFATALLNMLLLTSAMSAVTTMRRTMRMLHPRASPTR